MVLSRLAAHPRRALLGLLLFVLVAGVLGGPVAGKLDDSGGSAPGAESQLAVERIEAATGTQGGPAIAVLVDHPSPPRVRAVAHRLADLPGVVRTEAPGRAGNRALVTATLRAGADDEAAAQRALDALGDRPDVVVGGAAVADLQIGERVGADLGRAEALALPVLMLLSLLFFRGRAALMPLLVGLTTVLGTFLALLGINAVYGLNVFALNLVIGLGLGLAIDYTLFLLTRYREELEAHGATPAAIAATMRTGGRTVGFSAATVACALITLTVFPQGFLKSMGIAGATVAIVAGLAAVLVSPVLFGLWGAKLARRGRGGAAAHARWHRLAHAVMRRPGAIGGVAAVAMLALALPALGTTWTPVDSTVIPKDESARTVADAVEAGPEKAPVVVAIAATPAQRADVAAFADRVARLDGVEGVAPPRRLDERTWRLDATATGRPEGATAQRAVGEIRALAAPFDARVGGGAAEFVDEQASLGSRLLPGVVLLCALTMLVLWLMTGSVVLPVKAVLMNALTVGAALAPLTLIYQHGHLTGLLGYTSNGGVEPSSFLVTAALVFALSTDYGVFLLDRIREARERGVGEREAIATGLARTGRVVTAAAILLAVAIGAFSTSSISFVQQIGVATATGVLVDAFVVRTLLVPSLMALLGRWNWWSPPVLRRLHGRLRLPRAPRHGRRAEPQLAVR
jgi:uncharacterized membrane protein YdfJ with MMPL/SSD domain